MKRMVKIGVLVSMVVFTISSVFQEIVPVKASEVSKTKVVVSLNYSKDLMLPYIRDFEKKNPTIDIVYEVNENYDEAITNKIHKGTAPDVFFVPDAIQPNEFEEYLGSFGMNVDLGEKYNYMYEAKNIEGEVYGLPSSVYVPGFVYNKKVFENAGISDVPKSIEEFKYDLNAIKENTDSIPIYTNYDIDWALGTWENFPYLEMSGDKNYKMNRFIYEKNPFSLESNHGKVYSFLSSVISDDLCEPELGCYGWDKMREMLNSGEIGCVCMGSWALDQIKSSGEDRDDVGFFTFPNVVNGKQYATTVTDCCYGYNAKSKHPEEAKKFIEYMLDESGYAFDHEVISILKTDPLPESYSMENVVLGSNQIQKEENAGVFRALSANLNLSNGVEQKRVMDAAAGRSDEVFEEILQDWNTRWESGRTDDMPSQDESDGKVFDNLYGEEYEFQLSEAEKEYVKTHNKVMVGYAKGTAPYCYIEKDEKIRGISVGILDYVTEKTKIEFIYSEYDSTSELLEAAQRGEVDIIACMEKDSAFEDMVKFSKVIIDTSKVVIKNDTKSINADKQVQAILGNEVNYSRYNSEKSTEGSSEGVEMLVCDNIDDAINKVNEGSATLFLTNYFTADFILRGGEYKNVNMIPVAGEAGMCMAFGKKVDSKLVSLINKAIFSFTPSEIQGMLIDSMDTPAERLSMKKLMSMYPVQSVLLICIMFIFIFVVVLTILHQRMTTTKMQALEAKRYKILAEISNEYIFDYEANGKILRLEQKLSDGFDFKDEVYVDDLNEIGDNERLFVSAFMSILQNDELSETEFFINDGESTHWYKMICSKIYDDKQALIQIIGKISDIQKEVEERASMLSRAEKDILTGVLNREGFNNELKNAFNNDAVSDKFAYGILDMDNFKGVNDLFGHAGGDDALKTLSDELCICFGDIGFVSRYGGDEFVVFINDATNKDFVESKCQEICKKMDREFVTNGKIGRLSISMGMVMVSKGVDIHEAFVAADDCLYEVKQKGKNSYRLKEYK